MISLVYFEATKSWALSLENEGLTVEKVKGSFKNEDLQMELLILMALVFYLYATLTSVRWKVFSVY